MVELRQNTNYILVMDKQAIQTQKLVYCFTKRCVDLSLSLLAMPVYLVIYALAAAAIEKDIGGRITADFKCNKKRYESYRSETCSQ